MSRKRSGRANASKTAKTGKTGKTGKTAEIGKAAGARRADPESRQRGTRARGRRGRKAPWVAIVLVLVAGALVAGFLIFRSLEIGAPGERIATSGVGQHLPEGQPIRYDSTPPIGGAHWPAPAAWGVSSTTIPDERAVHNLEHGGIVVSYNAIPADDLARLKALPATLPRDKFNEVKVVIHPYDRIPAGTLVLTAWGWREPLAAYDEVKVRAFIEAHQNACCESVP